MDFIDKEICRRLETGAISVWANVGDTSPPFIVSPLTVEPSKPRLCLNMRYLNLWMKDTPFKLDSLSSIPRFVSSRQSPL